MAFAFLKRIRKQKAVAWVPSGESDSGERTYGAPVEIKCRWEDYGGEDVDAAGKEFRCRARVMVDRTLPVGTILRRPPAQKNQSAGVALAALTGGTGAGPHTEATLFALTETYKVRKTETMPLIRYDPNNQHWTVSLSGRND